MLVGKGGKSIMETALIHQSLFDIEKERMSLQEKGFSRNEILKQMESKYRALAQKHSFSCVCCNTPVKMNLTKGDNRPFYFSHLEGMQCSYSENHKVYQHQQEISEDNIGKQVEITILREILKGQLKPFNVKVERGYLYKKRLSFVPDFILTFSNEKKWAVDYHTRIQHGKENTFAKQLNRRKQTYADEGFQVFSLVDDRWLAINEETGKGTLLSTETNFVMKSKEDFEWDNFIFQLEPKCLDMLNDTLDNESLSVDTKSIQYLNIKERTCKIVRFLETADGNDRTTTILPLAAPIKIPLASALTLNEDQSSFQLVGEQEDALRNEFKEKLLVKVADSKVVAEPVKPSYPVYITPPSKDEFKKRLEESSFYQNLAKHIATPGHIEYDPADEEVKRQMAKVAEQASHRPIGLNEFQWNQQLHGNPYPKFTPNTPVRTTPEKTDLDPYQAKKRIEFRDKILNSSIAGSQYIENDSILWKRYVLRWIKEETVNEEVSISLSKVVNEMKQAGFTFNQKDELIQYPIQSFLNYYQKELKKNLKQTLTVNYY